VQSELALIKSELANIKANQLSGDQKVSLSGTNVADGTTVPALSVVMDPNGYPVLRTVSAAQFGYDDANDEYRIRGWVDFERPRVSTTIDTLVDAVTIPPGGDSGRIFAGVTNEYEIWFLVNSTARPWSLRANPPYASTLNPRIMFPTTGSITDKTENMGLPYISLYTGIRFSGSSAPFAPATLQEARSIAMPPHRDLYFDFVNESDETGTVTVRVLRVWAK